MPAVDIRAIFQTALTGLHCRTGKIGACVEEDDSVRTAKRQNLLECPSHFAASKRPIGQKRIPCCDLFHFQSLGMKID